MGEFSDMTMLNFDERKVPLVFRENRRARRIIMRLDYGAASVVVVLPKRTSRQEGKRFALSNKDWIEERLDQLAEPIPFENGEEIVERANNNPYGLAAAVWTKDISKAHQIAAEMRAGTVWINCYNIFDAAMPFGGYKESGWGREMGHDALELYTETKAVCARLS